MMMWRTITHKAWGCNDNVTLFPYSFRACWGFWLSRGIDLILMKCDNQVISYYSNCLADLAEGEMLQLEGKLA